MTPAKPETSARLLVRRVFAAEPAVLAELQLVRGPLPVLGRHVVPTLATVAAEGHVLSHVLKASCRAFRPPGQLPAEASFVLLDDLGDGAGTDRAAALA